MSPKNTKELQKLRKKLDIVDLELLNIIKKKSIQLKIDPKITNRIWKNMIWSFIDYENRNFKKK